MHDGLAISRSGVAFARRANSHTFRTSPTLRRTYVLEVLLGDPPPPIVPDWEAREGGRQIHAWYTSRFAEAVVRRPPVGPLLSGAATPRRGRAEAVTAAESRIAAGAVERYKIPNGSSMRPPRRCGNTTHPPGDGRGCMRVFSRKAWKGMLARRIHDLAPRPDDATAAGIEFLLPTVPLDDVLPAASLAEVVMLPRLIRSHEWAMPEHELLTLGAIARMIAPRLVVEFGTFLGGSTLSIAANMPGGRVVTVDIDPSVRRTHEHGLGTGLPDFDVGCLFRGTRFASMIDQRFANTLTFDTGDLVGRADLVFVDADHTYEFTRRDTAMALTLVRPGGWILWHDYTWEPQHSECAGVTRAVNEFFERHGGCHHIAGTRFAIHQVPPRTPATTASPPTTP